LIIGNIGKFELMSSTAPAPYKGAFDELKMFNHALTSSEVSALYNQATLSSAQLISKKEIIYPNPAKDQIFIQLPDYNAKTLNAVLQDMSGQVIFKEMIKSHEIGVFIVNISRIKSSGTFILSVSGEKLNKNFKIIINK
jgi:hypothetical protein